MTTASGLGLRLAAVVAESLRLPISGWRCGIALSEDAAGAASVLVGRDRDFWRELVAEAARVLAGRCYAIVIPELRQRRPSPTR